jgi:hypothetical protein
MQRHRGTEAQSFSVCVFQSDSEGTARAVENTSLVSTQRRKGTEEHRVLACVHKHKEPIGKGKEKRTLVVLSVLSVLVVRSYIIPTKSSSLIIFTPKLCAFFNFSGPMLSPANKKEVLALIDPEFFPP